jgi:hypothetical protein
LTVVSRVHLLIFLGRLCGLQSGHRARDIRCGDGGGVQEGIRQGLSDPCMDRASLANP